MQFFIMRKHSFDYCFILRKLYRCFGVHFQMSFVYAFTAIRDVLLHCYMYLCSYKNSYMHYYEIKRKQKKRGYNCQSTLNIKENKSTYPRYDYFGHIV